MKKLALVLVSLAVVGGAAARGEAAAVLHYYDSYVARGYTSPATLALTALGETATTVEHVGFLAALGSQAWDLVIVDVPGNPISLANATALSAYIAGGGRAIMSYWDLDGTYEPAASALLAAAFDVSVAASFNTPQPVYRWDAGHPLFTAPTAVADLNTFGDWANDNGDELTPVDGALAVAGFTVSPAANKAAIVIGNGGRTIVNGFLFWDMSPSQNDINLITNEIHYELTGGSPPQVVPEPAALLLAAPAVLAVLLRRRARV